MTTKGVVERDVVFVFVSEEIRDQIGKPLDVIIAKDVKFTKSLNMARKMIEGGAIKIADQRVIDPKARFAFDSQQQKFFLIQSVEYKEDKPK